jgi:hypothetical protein
MVNKGGHVMELRRPLTMVVLSLFFSLAAPAAVSALPTNLDGCMLDFGVTCDLGFVQFYVNEVNGGTSDPRVGREFAKVRVAVEAFLPSHPLNTGRFDEFEYRYQIFDQQFAVTEFVLDLSMTPPPAILEAGFKPDANPNTITPVFAGYSASSQSYAAVFLGPPLLPGTGTESDVLFIRSTANPADIVGDLGGSDGFANALVGHMVLKGPGSEITASSHSPTVPEPATAILLGSGLLALAAGLRLRQKETPQGVLRKGVAR